MLLDRVCVILIPRKVGRAWVREFYGVAENEPAARKYVMDTFYTPGTDPSVLDDESLWNFSSEPIVSGSVPDQAGRGRFVG